MGFSSTFSSFEIEVASGSLGMDLRGVEGGGDDEEPSIDGGEVK